MYDYGSLKDYYSQEILETFKEARVVLLVPITRTLPRFWESVVDMVAFSWNFGLRVEMLIPSLQSVIVDARTYLNETALNATSSFDGSKYTHFLSIDDDHTFAPDLACNLVYKMAMHDAKIMSAVCFKKGADKMPPIHILSKQDGVTQYKKIVKFPKTVFKVDTVGFGVIMIKREVYETVSKPWFRISPKISEDNFFCLKAKKAGFDIYVDGACTTGHIGEPVIIDESNYEEYLKGNDFDLEAIRIED